LTWIVGTSTPFGYAIAASDIRVTLSDGTELDCLRKIHAVGRNIALGFAGSVEIGFSMVHRLYAALRSQDQRGSIPGEVARMWQAEAQLVFENSPPAEQALGTELMMIGVRPVTSVDIPGQGEADVWQASVYVFRGPVFASMRINHFRVVSIGSGSVVSAYAEALERTSKDPTLLHFAGAGGAAVILGSNIKSDVQNSPTPGISPHVHVCVAAHGGILIKSNDTQVEQGGRVVEDFKMPPVADSMESLREILNRNGCAVAGTRAR
jgi:hypothetical protein